MPGAFQFPQNGPQLIEEDTPFLSLQTEGCYPQVPYYPDNLSLPTEQHAPFLSPVTMNPMATVSQLPRRKAPRAQRVSLIMFNFCPMYSNEFFMWSESYMLINKFAGMSIMPRAKDEVR